MVIHFTLRKTDEASNILLVPQQTQWTNVIICTQNWRILVVCPVVILTYALLMLQDMS